MMRGFVIKRSLLIFTLITVGCSNNPSSPTGASESVTWTVNGQPFTATSNGRGALRAGTNLSLTGAACGNGAILGIGISNGANGAGTYSLPQTGGGLTATWTPDARSGASANEAWNAPGIPRVVNGVLVSGGSGAVTISSMSADWVSGTFRFEVVANPSNRDTANKTIEGSFELSFKERTIC